MYLELKSGLCDNVLDFSLEVNLERGYIQELMVLKAR